LLTLPKSDLKQSNPTLVLTAVPYETFLTGNILANSKSASLVTPTHSYGFTTIGTSNTLVVWEVVPKKEEEEESTTTTTTKIVSSSSNMKMKLQCVPQPCRLIHPGGSGASFLSHEETHLEAHQVRPLLPRSTSTLALLLQHSKRKVETVISTMTVIAIQNSTNSSTNSTNSSTNDWHALPEDDVWQAQAAVVQTLCEEDDKNDDDDSTMESKVAQRLASSGFDSSTATAMAHQFWKLACQGGVVVHCETVRTIPYRPVLSCCIT
jgi:hypothetical protein